MGLYRASNSITTNIKNGVLKTNAPIKNMQLATNWRTEERWACEDFKYGRTSTCIMHMLSRLNQKHNKATELGSLGLNIPTYTNIHLILIM